MSRYLVGWDLADRRVTVVGGGSIGEGKVETLRATGARVTVVDPAPSDRVAGLARSGQVLLRRRRFRPWDVARASLVIAATGEGPTNLRVARWARRAGALVNVVDDPANCDVIVPAVIRRGPATVAITTDGATPAGARFLRETVEAAIPPTFGPVLDTAASARHRLRSDGRYRYDYPAWKQRLFEPGLAAAVDGRPVAADELGRRFLAEFEHTTPLRSGRVTLVGAGPGGAQLVTVAGAAALARADVVVYDRLADTELLDLAPVTARRIPVGKAKGSGSTQEEINRLLVHHAAAGSDVVRLKGGDPLLYGRGGEEADAVTAAGLPVRIVPGVSSALAAPALAGIPVTDRRVSASLTVLTGHRVGGEPHVWSDDELGADTLVILMAATTGAEVGRRLLATGRPGSQPVAAVHAAGTPHQEVTVLDLAGLARHGCPHPAPTVLVVGEVVGLRCPGAGLTGTRSQTGHPGHPDLLPGLDPRV